MAQLKKVIGLYGLTMVAIGSCIGSGIFLTPSQIAGHLPTPILILIVWALGGLVTVTGALTFSEMGAMFPQAGGVYAYLKEAYGDIFGFLYGWAYLLVITSGAMAALSIAFAQYLDFIVPLGQTGIIIVAISAIVCLTVINILRVKAGEIFSNVFTGLKLLGIAAIVLIGLFLGDAKTLVTSSRLSESTTLWNAFGLALIGVLWSYGGWQHATFLAGETKNAQRTVPRAMIIGAFVVTLTYLSINLAFMFLLPVDEIAASNQIAADAISTVLPSGGFLIAVIIAISVIGTVSIFTLSTPRIYFAMAQDGLFFKSLARVHERFHTPANAIILQSSWAIVLLLLWGTFEDVITYVVFTDWIFFGLTAAAIFVFRHKRKDIVRSYRTFGYPITPIIFISITCFFVVNTLIQRPLQAWAGLILMGIGIIVYFLFKRQKSKEAPML